MLFVLNSGARYGFGHPCNFGRAFSRIGGCSCQNLGSIASRRSMPPIRGGYNLTREQTRPQLAVFLHERHSRTCASIKARALLEPDSLGG
jgi:hypothetical protein